MSGGWTLKGRITLFALMIATAGLVIFPVIAQAATGTVKGTVSDAGSGDPITGIQVQLLQLQGADWIQTAEAQTDDVGGYEFAGMATGSYVLSFNEGRSNQRYADAYYLNKSTPGTANAVLVTAGGTVTANQQLTYVPANIIGHVKNSNGDPMANVRVDVYKAAIDTQADNVVYTDDAGNYEIRFLQSGDTRYLGFSPDSAQEAFYGSIFYLNAETLATADEVTYDPMVDPMPVQDVTLPSKPPSITGVVSKVGAPDVRIPDIEMQVWWVNDQNGIWERYNVPDAFTDWDGHYMIHGVPASTPEHRFYVRAFDPTGHFAPKFYGASASTTGTEVIVVYNDTATGIDLSLSPLAPSVRGKVTEAGTGRAIRNCAVFAFQMDSESGVYGDEPTQQGWTDASGNYEIYGLYDSWNAGAKNKPSKLAFNWYSDSRPAYSEVWYSGKTSLGAGNEVITVTGTSVTANAMLTQRPVSIKGKVFGEVMPGNRLKDSALYNVEVNLEQWDPVVKAWDSAAGITLEQDGSYAFYALVAGNYRVQVRDPGGNYYTQYYTGAKGGTREAAKGASVAYSPLMGMQVADFWLSPADPGISGTVRSSADSSLIADIGVTLYTFDPDAGEWIWSDNAQTNSSGAYQMTGPLWDGGFGVAPVTAQVLVQFEDSRYRYRPEWYDDQVSQVDATPVDLTFDNTTVVNASLAKNTPAITGHASTVSGPAEGVEVAVYPDLGTDSWEPQYWATTNAAGNYEVYIPYDATPPALGYTLSFISYDNKYSDQVYNGLSLTNQIYPADDLSFANRVIWAGPGTSRTGIDAHLVANAPSISGHVTNIKDGSKVKNLAVYAFSHDPAENDGFNIFEAVGSTDVNGDFVLYGLQNGKNYKIEYADENGAGIGSSYLPQWYNGDNVFPGDDIDGIANSSVGAVANTPVTTGIDARLILGEDVEPIASSDIGPTYTGSAQFAITGIDPEPWGPGSGSGVKRVSYKLDGASVVSSPDGTQSVALTVTGLGTHTIEYWVEDWSGNESAHVTDKFAIVASIASRITKATRPETSIALASAANPGWFGVRDILLACGDDRAAADSLSAAGLSWAYSRDGVTPPLLLIPAASTPSPVKAAIAEIVKENGRVTIHVVGGTGSIPDARINEIKAYVKSVRGLSDAQMPAVLPIDRLAAAGNRFDLAKSIALRMKTMRGPEMPGYALIANGADADTFFDALALGPISARNGAPILLVSKVAVPTQTSSALAVLGIPGSKTYIAGGTGTVPAAIAAKLRVPAANRLWGANRYSTALAIVGKALSSGWLNDQHVAVAASLPDALPAGVMVGGRGGVLLITSPTPLQAGTRAWLTLHAANIDSCYVAGGLGSIPAATLASINKALTLP